MSNTIAFLERKQTEAARKSFQNTVASLGIKIFTDWNELSPNIPQVLFYHGGDEIYLREDNRSSKPFRKELNKVYLVEYGGDPTVQKQPEKNIVSYIKYSDLQEKLENIISEIKITDIRTSNQLSDIVFGFDPKLEELLEPFAKINPMDSDFKQKEKLNKAKSELNDYMKTYFMMRLF